MHMDNPLAFANIIINDLIPEANEAVMTVQEYKQMGLVVDNVDYQEEFDQNIEQLEK